MRNREQRDSVGRGELSILVLGLAMILVGSTAQVRAQEGKKKAVKTQNEAAGTAEKTAPDEAALPPGVLARVNGRDIAVKEYADYLLASIGTARLGEYIDRLLIQAEARQQNIEVKPDEVEKLVEERIDRIVKGIYRGNRDEYLKGLSDQGTTLEERVALLRQEIYYKQLLKKLILSQRALTLEATREEFEKLYGTGGVQYELRHILVSVSKRTGAGGEKLPVRSEGEARARAESIRKELTEGGDFVQLVKRYSDDTLTRRNDGRIPLYREGIYGKDFHAAVEQLSAENPTSGVVRSSRGFHLIQLVKKRVTRFDDVREEIEELLRNRAPSRDEENQMVERLRKAAKIVR